MPAKVHVVKAMVFPVVIYRCESWTIKKVECPRIDAFDCGAGEDSWESLGQQGDQTSQPKGNQPWIFIGMTDAEIALLWPPDAKSQLIVEGLGAGENWRQKDKGVAEMAR